MSLASSKLIVRECWPLNLKGIARIVSGRFIVHVTIRRKKIITLLAINDSIIFGNGTTVPYIGRKNSFLCYILVECA